MNKHLIAIILSLSLSIGAIAQDLPRRVFLGIRMENLTQDSRNLIEMKDSGGVLVAGVIPNSSAEEAGFRKGDVLLSLNGKTTNSTSDVFAVLAPLKAGERFSYEIYRGGKRKKGSSVFKGFPEEKYADLDVVYTHSESETGKQRIIITKPRTEGKKPVVAFIGGIGCYSLDFGMDTNRSEVKLLNSLARSGYLCARLEKPGMGDNANFSKPCNQVSFTEETYGYVAAIKALKQRPDVDSNAIFIFGHSMGGVFAPLVAQQTPVKGIIAYGTIGSNFQEYLAKTRRTIGQAYDMSPEETDQLVKDFCECSGYYIYDKLSSEEAGKKNESCREYMGIFDIRSKTYNEELFAFNFPALWKSYEGKALLLWGGSDYISAKEDHEILTWAVNYYHKGNAEFRTIEQTDHGMNAAADFVAARINPGPYNPAVDQAIREWLARQ